MSHPYWPVFDLRIRTPRLELRLPTDADLVELATLTGDGIHDPDQMPFSVPWTDLPSPARERGLLQWNWSKRATFAPDDWWIDLAVSDGTRLLGVQGLFAVQFPLLRTVQTGSWLARAHQGRGIGREMRAAVLHLAFAGLGAETARSEAFDDNGASRRVSVALGYRPDGTERRTVRGIAREMTRFRLDRADWEAGPRIPVELAGLAACLPMFGLPAR
jgi:RimJ/RimL family protein N-acetyltransferase